MTYWIEWCQRLKQCHPDTKNSLCTLGDFSNSCGLTELPQHASVGILKLELICLENCVYKAFFHLLLMKQGLLCLNKSWWSNAHECVDEVTVNRDKPPSATVGTGVTSDPSPHHWASLRLAVSVGRLITNTHLGHDGLWWMVAREPWGQPRQPHLESTSWPHKGVFMWMWVRLSKFAFCMIK